MIKFMAHYVTDGTVKAKVHYNAGQRLNGTNYVTIYAKDYGRDLGKIFEAEYKNDTDIMTDYFERGHVTLEETHPLYADCVARAKINAEKSAERYAKRRAKWAAA